MKRMLPLSLSFSLLLAQLASGTTEVSRDVLLQDGWEEVHYSSNALAHLFYEFCPNTYSCQFTLATGPGWLHVVNYAYVTGKPRHGDIGPFRIEVQATNEGGQTKTISASGQILAITAPPKWLSNPLVWSNQKVGAPFGAILSRHLGGGGHFEKFEVTGAPSWIEGDNNYLHGTPGASDIGDVRFAVRVIGPTGLYDDADVAFTVVP